MRKDLKEEKIAIMERRAEIIALCISNSNLMIEQKAA